MRLSKEVNPESDLSYTFATYKPMLTDSGKCELDYKKSNFDTNIYNILEACDNHSSISEIALNTFMSLEEIANYFLFGVDEGYIQIPDDSQILSIAGFLAGKYRTGEYFMHNGTISESQLDDAVISYEQETTENKKFGQSLIGLGLISQKQLNIILKIKEEAKKRFILDHNEVPRIEERHYEEYEKRIKELKYENQQLKKQVEKLSLMVKKND